MNTTEHSDAGQSPAPGSPAFCDGHSLSIAARRSPETAWSRKVLLTTLLGFAFFSPWSISGAQVCLGLGLFSWMVSLLAGHRRRVVRSALFWPMVAYLGLQLFSVLLSPDLVEGLRAFRAEWIILLYFLVINVVDDDHQIRRLVGILVLSTVLVSLYAIWQHWSGWDLYRQRPLRATGSFFEATGLFGHHLTFGGYLMMVLVLSVSLSIFGTRGRTRLFYALSSGVLFLTLLFSYARSAWIGFLAGALGMAILWGRRTLFVVLLGIAVMMVVAALSLPSMRLQVGELVDLIQGPMTQHHRLQMWSAAWQLILDHPFFGAGAGQASQLLPAYGCDLGYAHLHNDLINVAANSGLLGLAAFLWIWATFLRHTARCHRRLRSSPWNAAIAAAGFGIVIAVLVAGQFQCYYTDAEDGMLLWLLMGLVLAGCPGKKDRGDLVTSRLTVPDRTGEDRRT